VRLLLLIVIVYLGYRAVKSWLANTLRPSDQKGRHNPKIDDVMIKDPVCGIYFPRREGVELQQGGQSYLFCSSACRDRFVERQKK
jgi:YHS domain-containing protein